MNRFLFVLLALLLTSCGATPTTDLPTLTATLPPTSTLTPTPLFTETPSPTATDIPVAYKGLVNSEIAVKMDNGEIVKFQIASQEAADQILESCQVAEWAQIMAAGEPWMDFVTWKKMTEANNGIVNNGRGYVSYKNAKGVETSYTKNNLAGLVPEIGEINVGKCELTMSKPIDITDSVLVNMPGYGMKVDKTAEGAVSVRLGIWNSRASNSGYFYAEEGSSLLVLKEAYNGVIAQWVNQMMNLKESTQAHFKPVTGKFISGGQTVQDPDLVRYSSVGTSTYEIEEFRKTAGKFLK